MRAPSRASIDFRVVFEQLDDAAADIAETKQRYSDRARHYRPRLYE